MENSYRYFENRDCKYYPCHKDEEKLNCLFCYCPLYALLQCPGEYNFVEVNGKKVKDCSECSFPHKAENYDTVMAFLSDRNEYHKNYDRNQMRRK